MLLKVALKGVGPIIKRKIEWFPDTPCPIDLDDFRRETIKHFEILRRRRLHSLEPLHYLHGWIREFTCPDGVCCKDIYLFHVGMDKPNPEEIRGFDQCLLLERSDGRCQFMQYEMAHLIFHKQNRMVRPFLHDSCRVRRGQGEHCLGFYSKQLEESLETAFWDLTPTRRITMYPRLFKAAEFALAISSI